MEDAFSGGLYEIDIGAALDDGWAHWFSDFELTSEGESTRLSGELADQSALHGVLGRLRDLGLPILAVQRLPDDQDGAAPRR